MKSIIKLLTLFIVMMMIAIPSFSQSMEKKYHTVEVAIKINATADKVWNAMVADYGHISNFSPYIYSSNYENGSLVGKEGAERKCNFNAKGTQWSHERLYDVDNKNRVTRNVVIGGKKLPLDYEALLQET